MPERQSQEAASPFTRQAIADDLAALGARQGDILYVRCGLGKIGVRAKQVEDVFLGGIFDAIGPQGTLIAPAFGKISYRWDKEIAVSTHDAPPITGGFSKMLTTMPNAYRSTHPWSSFVAIGARAEEILRNHSEDGAAFEPIREVVRANGLMALIGCVAESPGFSTVHLAQFDLGLSQRHHLRHVLAVRKNTADGPMARFVESPGCSRNFGAFYKDYIEDANFSAGYVGRAWSIAVRARPAYGREIDILKRNPRYPICNNPGCASCRLTRGYNKRAIPGAVLHHLKSVITRRRSK